MTGSAPRDPLGDERPAATSDRPTRDAFAALAEEVYAAEAMVDVYEAIVAAAPRLIDGCTHASLVLRRGDRFETQAATDDVARQIDSLERELGEGPCLDAIVEDPVYGDQVLADGSAWPRLTERLLADTPVRGMAGVRLVVGGDKTGALNVFADESGALGGRSVDQAIVLASFVTVALTMAEQRHAVRTLRDGLESNREIGKAIGLLMAFHKVDDEGAFAMLRKRPRTSTSSCARWLARWWTTTTARDRMSAHQLSGVMSV